MPLIFAFIAGMIGLFIALAKKKEAEQKAAAQRLAQAQAQKQAHESLENASKKVYGSRSEVLRTEASSGYAPQASPERRRLERESLEKSASAERPRPVQAQKAGPGEGKPIAAHTDADCGGGSIHDGYHEGVTQFDNGRPAAVAGRLGHRLAEEDERIEKEKLAADNARRALARIAKLPPLAQGMIYSEILGKPKSEIC